MKRLLLTAIIGLLSIAVVPAVAKQRPNPGAGSQGSAAERPSAPSSPAPSMPSSPPPSSAGSSGGGSSTSSSGSSSGGDHAVSRQGSVRSGHQRSGSGHGGPATGGTSQSGGRTGSTAGVNDPGSTTPGYGGYARPRGSHPAQATAVQRGDITPLPPYWHGGYWDYYYWFPYYGPWGLYFYWDPYILGDYPDYYGGYGGGPAYVTDHDAVGSLKLKVKPRTAQVYLDGYLTGIVDDFDGMFQSLKARPGGHRLEIRLDGYKPLVADVMVQPDATTTFRGELEPVKK